MCEMGLTLSAKHQSEHESMLFKPHEVHHEADNYDGDITDAMKSVPKTSPSKDFLVTKQSNVGILAEGRRSIDIALPG